MGFNPGNPIMMDNMCKKANVLFKELAESGERRVCRELVKAWSDIRKARAILDEIIK